MRSAAAAIKYYEQTDLLASSPGEWLGKGADMLGLDGSNNQDHFISLAHNLHPQTGEQLTTYSRENRRVGVDMTFSAPKSVSLARELANNEGDPRIEEAHREAVKYAMGMIENEMQARVRKGGALTNRTTGNLVAYRVTHRDTRINADDQMPDPQLHDHVFAFNATFDPVEKQWKAAEIGQLKHDAPYYEAAYHNRLATNLRQLGYGVERSGKSFEIVGVSQELRNKFSRRSVYIKQVAEKLGITNPQSKAKLGATTRLGKTTELADDLQPYYASRLTPAERFQLAALDSNPTRETSAEAAVTYAIAHMFERQSVVDEKRLYETAIRHGIGSVTPEAVQQEAKRQGLLVKNGEATTTAVLAEERRVIAFARDGKGTCRPMRSPEPRGLGGPQGSPYGKNMVAGSTPHESVLLASYPAKPETATISAFDQQQKGRPDESKRPESVEPRSPVIPPLGRLRGTSLDVSASASSAAGAGLDASNVSSTGKPTDDHLATLSPEQQAGFVSHSEASKLVVSPNGSNSRNNDSSKFSNDRISGLSTEQAAIARHVWTSTDRVILIRGAAGTGKTHTMKTTIAGIDRPVVVLAPSADASRGVLRKEGFSEADTVSRFLLDEEFQKKAKNGVIWIDEAGLLGMRQVRQVFEVAEKVNARVVLQGDRKQHGSIERGTTLRVLEQFAGLPVAQLLDIRRQKGQYKEAVTSLSQGDILAGYDALNDLGWVKSTEDNTPLVEEYMAALDARKSVLAIAPTHAEANEVTDAIRLRLQERGVVSKEEREVQTLVPLHWTEAERGDSQRFDGTEVVQYHRKGGTFKAGEKIAISDFKPGMKLGPASTFSVYGKSTIKLAKGDRIRITAPGKSADGKHRFDSGAQYGVEGFDEKGRIILDNGWTLGADFQHLAHAYVSTSHASQGKTVERVLIAMGRESLPAISAEQFYVSVSRGREKATIFTDVPTPELRDSIQKADSRKSATELFNPQRRNRVYAILKRAREAFQSLRTRHLNDRHERDKPREHFNER